jgi:hypothetical protein
MASDPCELFIVYHLREIFECCPPGLLTRVRILFAVLVVSAQTKSSLYFVFFLYLLRTDEGIWNPSRTAFSSPAFHTQEATKKEVEEHFAQFDTLPDVHIDRGIAFVTFASAESINAILTSHFGLRAAAQHRETKQSI